VVVKLILTANMVIHFSSTEAVANILIYSQK
jgi:hypothetical protein